MTEPVMKKGKIIKTDLISNMQADDYTIVGSVSRSLSEVDMDNLIASTSQERKTPPMPLEKYRLPIAAKGMNSNWPVAFWRPNGTYSETSTFEDKAWARLDVTKSGPFFFGNSILADASELRIAVIKWTEKVLELEVNNPTDKSIKTNIRTNPEIKDRLQGNKELEIPAGSSSIVKLNSLGK